MQSKTKIQSKLVFLFCVLLIFCIVPTRNISAFNLSEFAYLFDDHHITLLSVPSGQLLEILNFSDSEYISTITFSPSQDNACLVSGLKKYESTKLYMTDSKSWKPTTLLQVEPNCAITKPTWSPDGKKLVVFVGYNEIASGDFTHYEYYLLKIFDLETKQMLDLVQVNEPVNSITWSINSNYLAFNGKEKDIYALYIYDFKNSKLTKPSTNLSSDWVFKNLNFWSSLEDKLYQVNGNAIFSYQINDSRYQQIKNLRNQIVTQQWNGVRNFAAVVWKDGENTKLDCINLQSGNQESIFQGYQIDSPRWSEDGEKISFFFKTKDQANSKLFIYDQIQKKKIIESDSGIIDIYPWDVDPTYSIWANQLQAILYVTKKEGQSQVLSLLSLEDKHQIEVSNGLDYIYNYGWSENDEWVYITGSKAEKDYIEFISVADITKKVIKPDLKFIEWKNDGSNQIPSNNTHQTSRKTILISILLIVLSVIAFIVFFVQFIMKKRR
jgi:Tol biopolymer transport system component